MNSRILQLLLQGRRDGNYEPALHYIWENRHHPELFNGPHGGYPLHIAICFRNLTLLTALLAIPGIDVNQTEPRKGRSALHSAASIDWYEGVKLLLATRAVDRQAKTQDDYTAEEIARANGYTITAELIANKSRPLNMSLIAFSVLFQMPPATTPPLDENSMGFFSSPKGK